MTREELIALALDAIDDLSAHDERPMRLEAIAVRVGKASALLNLVLAEQSDD
jgi:hypothetical protein